MVSVRVKLQLLFFHDLHVRLSPGASFGIVSMFHVKHLVIESRRELRTSPKKKLTLSVADMAEEALTTSTNSRAIR